MRCVQVSVDVRLPSKGEYGLEVFANDPEKEGDMFTHVCQYLCYYVDGKPEDLYGKVPTAGDLVDNVEAEEKAGDCHLVIICAVLFVIYFN